jgi:predicted ArsR family transcriptional regulator
MVTNTARQRVLEFLRRRGLASAAQIGAGLSMSAATVRHHLSILAADGRVVAAAVESKSKRGRPQKLFRLSDRLLGDNLGLLLSAALGVWLGGASESRRVAAMDTLGRRMAERARPLDTNPPAAKRLEQLTERLNGMHYQARWEAGAHGPRIAFGHCPYAEIIGKHPELCQMDAAFLGAEMNSQVEQIARIDPAAANATQCIFAVRPVDSPTRRQTTAPALDR